MTIEVTAPMRRLLPAALGAATLIALAIPAHAQAPTAAPPLAPSPPAAATPVPAPGTERPFAVPPSLMERGTRAVDPRTRACLATGAAAAIAAFGFGYYHAYYAAPVVGAATMAMAAPYLVPATILAFTAGCMLGAAVAD